MNARRIIGSLLATTMAASAMAVVATASPAAAATPTKIVGAGGPWLSYSSYRSQPGAPAVGDRISFNIDVASTDGSGDPYAGGVVVQRQLKGSRTWTTVARSSGAYLYDSTKAIANATYRAMYTGGSSYDNSWSPSPWTTKTVSVQRKLTISPKSRPKLGLAVKVGPKAKVKLIVLKKQGKKWKRYKAVKTTRAGKAFVKLPAPAKRGKKTFWKLRINKNAKFAQTNSTVYYTTKY